METENESGTDFWLSKELYISVINKLKEVEFTTLTKEATDERGGTQFEYYEISEQDALFDAIQYQLKKNVDFDAKVIRLHKFKPEDLARRHTDTGYEGMDTVVIKLDHFGEHRLLVDDYLVQAATGEIIIIPEGTYHTVFRGTQSRFTLTAWGNLDEKVRS